MRVLLSRVHICPLLVKQLVTNGLHHPVWCPPYWSEWWGRIDRPAKEVWRWVRPPSWLSFRPRPGFCMSWQRHCCCFFSQFSFSFSFKEEKWKVKKWKRSLFRLSIRSSLPLITRIWWTRITFHGFILRARRPSASSWRRAFRPHRVRPRNQGKRILFGWRTSLWTQMEARQRRTWPTLSRPPLPWQGIGQVYSPFCIAWVPAAAVRTCGQVRAGLPLQWWWWPSVPAPARTATTTLTATVTAAGRVTGADRGTDPSAFIANPNPLKSEGPLSWEPRNSSPRLRTDGNSSMPAPTWPYPRTDRFPSANQKPSTHKIASVVPNSVLSYYFCTYCNIDQSSVGPWL